MMVRFLDEYVVIKINGKRVPLEWRAVECGLTRAVEIDLMLPGYEAYLRAAEEINNAPTLDSVMRNWSKT